MSNFCPNLIKINFLEDKRCDFPKSRLQIYYLTSHFYFSNNKSVDIAFLFILYINFSRFLKKLLFI